MNKFFIEDGILKAYFGNEAIVTVPDGVKQVGGDRIETEEYYPAIFCNDVIGYRGFYCNEALKELYLPDSVTMIGYKALEHCKSLKVMSFSNNLKTFDCNAIVGCDSLKTIVYRGTIYEFSCMEFPGQTPDLDVVYCTDGKIQFGKDRQYYIDTLYFPGTRAEWNEKHGSDDWRNMRCKNIICEDEKDSLEISFKEAMKQVKIRQD